MTETQTTITPVDGTTYVERELATESDLEAALGRANRANSGWRAEPLEARAVLLREFIDRVEADVERLSDELTWQMGRPISQAPGEIAGFCERGRTMVHLGLSALRDMEMKEQPGFTRFIRREPLGLVMVLAPWNYPWLTAVNAVVPALMAGNTVLLKHASQTPLVAERMVQHARAAGIPEAVFSHLHMSHKRVAQAVADPRVGFVAFTGSVAGGHAIQQAAASRFVGTGLELGGKDPGYVAPDADVDAAAAGLVDGAFFNSGQSCCGIERIYVHEDVYERFVDRSVAAVSAYRLGDPTDPETNLGPVVRVASARAIRSATEAAIAAGASGLIDASGFAAAVERGDPYLAPQVLVGVTHDMQIMTEETFGPVVGIVRVSSDDEAVKLMNDSRYGLTAAVYTADVERARRLGDRLETGTVFMNRCDYLDPELAWVGVKDSGRGCTLSRLGYEQLTRPKSFHLRH